MRTFLCTVLSLLVMDVGLPLPVDLQRVQAQTLVYTTPSVYVEGFFIFPLPLTLNPPVTGSSQDDLEQEASLKEQDKLAQEAKDKEEAVAQAAQKAAAAAVEAQQAPPAPPRYESYLDVQNLAHSLTVADFGEAEWPFMYSLIMAESGFNLNALNPTSGACGLPQALPCSKLPDHSASGQISWMLRYVKDRYGTPSAAWSFHLRMNWY